MLLVVVFVTLLEPESQRPIEGVQGPAGQSPTVLPGPDVYTADPGNGGGQPGGGNGEPGVPGGPGAPGTPGTPGGPGGAAVPGGPGVPELPTGTEGLGITGPGPTEGEAREGGSPADEQYLSALDRLTGDLE